eukprot:scaffold187854_cov21-Prasinocladus_malaysianus.AAC.2
MEFVAALYFIDIIASTNVDWLACTKQSARDRIRRNKNRGIKWIRLPPPWGQRRQRLPERPPRWPAWPSQPSPSSGRPETPKRHASTGLG